MKIIPFLTCLLFTIIARAQLLKVSTGTDLTIMSGTVFKTEDFILTPSADFTISNNSIIKSDTIIHTSANSYISRVYQFTNTTSPYSGSVQINYTDGAELNGIPENSLTLNVHNGISWGSYTVATRDAINNFVLTPGLSAINLNELTLANVSGPLPLTWVSFTATRQNQTALLQWATAEEQNTLHFIIQHSRTSLNWTNIGALPAAGNSSIINNYSYVHTIPASGINFYRILQVDIDGRSRHSKVRVLDFTKPAELFTIIGNPVGNGVLILQVNTVTLLGLYAADGKLVWKAQVDAGTNFIDVSGFAKGIYLLKANSTVQKIVIQ